MGICAVNCPEWVLVQYATARIGAIMVNINPAYRTHEVEYVLRQGGVSLLLASASIRNNRPDIAREARRMATTAASALGREHMDFREHWGTFGPVTAETKAIEDLSLVGDVRGVLGRADEGPVGSKALKKLGRPSPNNWDRHRLDVARAHVKLGSHQDAMDELTGITATSPEWLKHQTMARRVMREILGGRKRTLTQDMREMAAHLGISG